MTALMAKKLTSGEKEVRVFYTFLQHNYEKFMESYFEWEKTLDIEEYTLNITKTTTHFNGLFGPPKERTAYYKADTEIDFNYMVDYIF